MAISNSLTKSEKKEIGITDFLSSAAVKSRIINAVGEKDAQKFVLSIVSAVNQNKDLADCDHTSILVAALAGATLKLSPALGQFYMVPFKSTKENKILAQFILGYKGYIQLAIRSGQYKSLTVFSVKKGEYKGYNPLTDEVKLNLIEDFEARQAAETVGYVAAFELLNGFRKVLYWPKDRMVAHADKYSKAFSKDATTGRNAKVSYADYLAGKYPAGDEWKYSSYWYTSFDDMACKTMLRQLIGKWGVMSEELKSAYNDDGSVIDVDGTIISSEEYIENDTPQAEPQPQEAGPDIIDAEAEPADDISAALFR